MQKKRSASFAASLVSKFLSTGSYIMGAISTSKEMETAVIVGVASESIEKEHIYLDELTFLAETAEVNVVKRFIQKLERPDKRSYVGSGKLDEIKAFVLAENINTVIFDDELSPSQLRNTENFLQIKILDRTTLILDIFAKHARTASARTQVELAQYQYLMPRLTRMWTHLSKQRGGVGMRGPGEKEIETDRRIVRDKISLLKEKLKEIDQQKITQRKNRERLVRVALVGYTNVGKSTIMNLLGKSEVLAENKLFATLDTTVRKVVVGNLPFLLTDTVGFIRKLPHHLVESFKSTLDEVRESDVLIHVVDISHKEFEEQLSIVSQTLKEITQEDKKTLIVFNKIDAYTYEEKELDDLSPTERKNYTLEDMKNMWIAKAHTPCFFMSAKEKTNFPEFREFIYREVKKIHENRYPYDKFLYEEYTEEEA